MSGGGSEFPICAIYANSPFAGLFWQSGITDQLQSVEDFMSDDYPPIVGIAALGGESQRQQAWEVRTV